MFKKLLAIDPSLRSSGWVLFDVKTEKPLKAGIIGESDSRESMSFRLLSFQKKVDSLYKEIELNARDVLVLEGPAQLVLNPSTSTKVEQIRGIFESLARSRGVFIPGRINPRTLQVELLGMKGKQKERKEVKLMAQNVSNHLYGDTLRKIVTSNTDKKTKIISQDIVDASLIGALSLSKIRFCSGNKDMLLELFEEKSFKNRIGQSRKKVRWTANSIKNLSVKY